MTPKYENLSWFSSIFFQNTDNFWPQIKRVIEMKRGEWYYLILVKIKAEIDEIREI